MILIYQSDDCFRKELINIVQVELKNHFKENQYGLNPYNTSIEIDNNAFVQDLENAKLRLSEKGYMTDFMSDVQENLSFVPKIIIQ